MGFVGNLVLSAAAKNVTNQSRFHKVIAMFRVGPFFDSRCICTSRSLYMQM